MFRPKRPDGIGHVMLLRGTKCANGAKLTRQAFFVCLIDQKWPLFVCIHRQLINMLIVWITIVAFDPHETHAMFTVYDEKPLPQIRVFLLGEVDLLPIKHPLFRNRINNILAIAVNHHVKRFAFERFKSDNNREQFHAIVGCVAKSTFEFSAVFAPNQECSIASRAWISAGTAVGINDHFQIGNFGEVNTLTKCLDGIMRRLCTKTMGIVDSLKQLFRIGAKQFNGYRQQNYAKHLSQDGNSGVTK